MNLFYMLYAYVINSRHLNMQQCSKYIFQNECFVSLLEMLMAQCEGSAILGLLKHVIFVLTALSDPLKVVIRIETASR